MVVVVHLGVLLVIRVLHLHEVDILTILCMFFQGLFLRRLLVILNLELYVHSGYFCVLSLLLIVRDYHLYVQ